MPVDYEHNTLDEVELYDLKTDLSETTDVAAEHPEVVEKMSSLADEMRKKLGDKLTGIEGRETRSPGMTDQIQEK